MTGQVDYTPYQPDSLNMIVIKLSQSGASGTGDLMLQNNSFQVFPNPFNSYAKIKINNENLNHQSIDFVMYDLLGNEIKHQQVIAGEKEFVIERRNISEGIYFYKLTNNHEIIGTGKLIIQ